MKRNQDPTDASDAGRVTPLGAAMGTMTVALVGAALIGVTHNQHVSHENNNGREALDKIKSITVNGGSIGSGVRLRTSPDLNNGSDTRADNLIPELPKGIPAGQTLTFSHAGFTEKGGDIWAIVKRPQTPASSDEVAYVDLSKLERDDQTDLMTIDNGVGHGGPLLASDVATHSANVAMIDDVSYQGHSYFETGGDQKFAFTTTPSQG